MLDHVNLEQVAGTRSDHKVQVNAREIIHEVLPDLVEREAIPTNGIVFYLIIGVGPLINRLNGLVTAFLPTVSSGLTGLIAVLLWILFLILGKRLFDRIQHPKAIFVRPLRDEFFDTLAGFLFVYGGIQLLLWLSSWSNSGAISAPVVPALMLGQLFLNYLRLRLWLRIALRRQSTVGLDPDQSGQGLTLLDQPEEVELLIQQALREANQNYKPGLAGLHYRIGHIRILQGQPTLAADHFRKALEYVPNGGLAIEIKQDLQNLAETP